MKKYFLLLAILLLVVISSCKKDKKRPYSEWYVNNDRFYTNNVDAAIGKSIAAMGSNDQANRFAINFHYGIFPKSGSYPLSHTTIQAPDSVELSVYYNNELYVPAASNHSALHCSAQKDKAEYTLDSCWFANYYNAADSVTIHGTFREP